MVRWAGLHLTRPVKTKTVTMMLSCEYLFCMHMHIDLLSDMLSSNIPMPSALASTHQLAYIGEVSLVEIASKKTKLHPPPPPQDVGLYPIPPTRAH